MDINLTFIKDVIILVVCAVILIQGAANLIRRNPTITSEHYFIWFLLSFFGFNFIDKFDSNGPFWKHSEYFYTSLGFMIYLILAIVIIVILAFRGKVAYGYVIGGADRDSIVEAISKELDDLHIEYTYNNSKFQLSALNNTLEMKYYKWSSSARLRIENVGNQKLLNELVRFLRHENKPLLRFNNRASLIEFGIGLIGLILSLFQIFKSGGSAI